MYTCSLCKWCVVVRVLFGKLMTFNFDALPLLFFILFFIFCSSELIHHLALGRTKRQPPAVSREANTDVTKTAIHRLATGGGLQKGVNPIDPPPPHVKMPNFTAENNMFTAWCKKLF